VLGCQFDSYPNKHHRTIPVAQYADIPYTVGFAAVRISIFGCNMPETRRFIPAHQAQPPFFVGIDLGGTNIKVGTVDDLGRPLSWLSIPTEVHNGPEDAARRMGQAVHQAARQAGLELGSVARVGLGSPGGMDIPAGMLLEPANLKGWNHFPIRDRVSHHCGLPVAFENDANAAAYGEYWMASERKFHSMVLLTLGTGIGCGIIVGDLVIHGAHSNGAEAGHIVIDPREDAQMCGCGQRGHFEAYANATSVIRRAREALDAGRTSSLSKHLTAGCKLTPKLIANEAESGDELAIEVIAETARYLGLGVSNLMYVIDPDVVLLGGAMTFGGRQSELGCRFLNWVKQTVQRLVWPVMAEKTVIDFAALGGDAGFIGAAGVARLEYLQGK
jgi:glucokinase